MAHCITEQKYHKIKWQNSSAESHGQCCGIIWQRRFLSLFEVKDQFAIRRKRNYKNITVLSPSILWGLGWTVILQVNFTFRRPTKFLAVRKTQFYYQYHSLPKAWAKLHIPAGVNSRQPMPEGRSPSRLPRHKYRVLAYRTIDYFSLERNVRFAIFPTRTGNTFDVRASGKSLLLSASRLPRPYSFAKSDIHESRALQKHRKSLSRMARWGPNRHNRLRFSKDGYLFILTLFHKCWKALTVIKVQRLPTEYFL